MKPSIQSLVIKYKAEQISGNEVVKYSETYVYSIIHKIHVPSIFPMEDVTQQAWLGFSQALYRYDVEFKTPFVSYAQRRIQGAVTDYLQHEDPVIRRARKLIALMNNLEDLYVKQEGRKPSRGEKIEYLESEKYDDPHEILETIHDGKQVRRAISFSDRRDEDNRTVEDFIQNNTYNPEIGLLQRQVREAYEQLNLPEREQQILDMQLEGFNLKEIGKWLGLTNSRINQIVQKTAQSEEMKDLRQAYRELNENAYFRSAKAKLH